MGIGLDTDSHDPEPPIHSPFAQAQVDAEERYRTLAADLRMAAPAATALGPQLLSLASDLDAQADAVALPRPAESPVDDARTDGPSPIGDPSAPAEGASPDITPDAPAPTPADVLQRLRASSLLSLLSAVDAEPGPSRVLAAAGANQWRHTVLLADALGEDSGLPAAGSFPAADLSAGTGLFADVAPPVPAATADASSPAPAGAGDEASADTGDCVGTPLGSDADRRALLTALTAEEQAGYAYEVAAALQPEQGGLLEESALHAAAADTAADRLAALCSPADPAPPGFALGQVFRADPVAALRVMEQEHAAMYAGVIPTVSRAERGWAIASLTASVQRSASAGTALETFPGLRVAPPEGTPATGPDADAGTSDG